MNIDHFQQLAKTNNQKKQDYAQRAQATIDQGVSDILKELRMHDVISYLPQIKEKPWNLCLFFTQDQHL